MMRVELDLERAKSIGEGRYAKKSMHFFCLKRTISNPNLLLSFYLYDVTEEHPLHVLVLLSTFHSVLLYAEKHIF